MHTDTSWNGGDVVDGHQPIQESGKAKPTASIGSSTSATDNASTDSSSKSYDEALHTDAPVTMQPTMREKTSEYDALLSRVLKQIDEAGSAGFVGFTGCNRRSGVSTIAANVAIRAADQHNGPVLLVEANLSNPRQHLHFGTVKGPGLFDVLGTGMALDQAITATRVADLYLLDAGTGKTHIPPIVLQEALEGFVQELRERFSLVVFDLPSDESLSHWAPLVRSLDSLMLVISSEETTQGDLIRVQNQCKLDKINISGSILNRHRSYIPRLLRRK